MPVFLCISYIFIICSALEAPRPVPNCRSHFSAQTRVIESFWNPQGTSFVTKQCPKCIAKIMQNLDTTTNQLVGCSQATNQLAGGLQTTNQLVGGLQTANQLGKVGKWVGSGRGSSRLVQNDQRNCRNVFKRVLAKDSLKKRGKPLFFMIFSLFGVSRWGNL